MDLGSGSELVGVQDELHDLGFNSLLIVLSNYFAKKLSGQIVRLNK